MKLIVSRLILLLWLFLPLSSFAGKYFWIGGSGSFHTATNWSITSGGAPAASLPSALDTVFFDAQSNLNASSVISANANIHVYAIDFSDVNSVFSLNALSEIHIQVDGSVLGGNFDITFDGLWQFIQITGLNDHFITSGSIIWEVNFIFQEGTIYLVAINSDDAEMGRRLNQEAAKSVKYGGMSQEDAWKMITLNPAKLLHLDDRMGSLKVGKDADVVIWTDNPLSIHAKVVSVFIDGELVYNYKDDQRAQSRNQSERARIIAKLLEDNKKGNPSKPFIKKEEKHWHCDTIGEHGEE